MAKFVNVGSICQAKGKDGNDYQYIQLNNFNLKAFIEYLSAFGAENLKGKDLTDKKLPKVRISMYSPNEKAPDFILNDLVLKIEE
jgi:hypothetical protein